MRESHPSPARVLLYVPNIIGYLRIALAVIAFRQYRDSSRFFTAYLLGFLLDAADGLAARRLQQSSLFGALLDMLTDRCSAMALVVVLGRSAILAPPQKWPVALRSRLPLAIVFICVALILLDAVSHLLQMCAGLVVGSASHKAASRLRLVQLYYTRWMLTTVCLLSELFLLLSYLLCVEMDRLGTVILKVCIGLWVACAPVYLFKQLVSAAQIHGTVQLLSR
ncbi:hypothetical protein CDCA_CDCA07G2195 [Cyanidium caldarium]|uniref:CDP-diacylglycerol--inositol 3-phosphatidyltransferase n=1 Tax=Cyanidium caldarium TaxID=2771 RepID=A0AAV9IVM9_CYACA|nr:hypothetical protein CDCA_CDCA07G2195 [Cyanidium caldarium]